ncbi:MAG: tetratricopeptide repeat protein, partial [Candidatus Hydrogenedentes bacterium]|nr:tetratricopeptide repeat protein [Candidatus Hydrogenedentota bacterium]
MPITTISRMLDVQLFGMNFAGHHAANLFYHACAVIVLFWLLRRSTGRPWCSAFAASLFAVHPLNAGTVAWFSCRHDILSALLGLLALLAYARYAAGPSVRRYVPVMILFAMSLMSKPVFTTFPAVMLFLDFWPLKRMEDLEFGDQAGRMRFCRLVAEKIPLFVIGLSIAVLGYFGQRSYGTISSSDAYPFLKRAANAATSYVTYLWNGLWPTGLAACYPYPAMLWWKTAGALALLAACTAFAIVYRKRFPYIFVGWFWYGLALLPSSGILAQLGDQSRADRYTYVPMIGLFVAASWGLGAVVRRWRRTAVALPVAVVTAVAAYAAVAHVQVHYWSDSATLFQHAIDVTSDNYMAYAFLGKALAGQGRDEEAIAAFKEALRIAPHSIEVHNNLGNVLYRKGSYGEAVGHFAEALRRNPGDATDLHNMDLALSRPLVAAFQRQTVLHNMGLALLAQDKCDEAIACFRQAIAANPDFALAHNNLGYALARKGAFEEAVVEYREALRTEPKFGLALYNMGDALLAQGKCEDAIQTYTHAAEADPQKRHEALNNIGNVLVRQGKNDEAVAYFRQAIAANPDFALAHNNLGYELARKGGLAEAVAEYREALRSDPNF